MTQKIGELLVEAGHVQPEDVERALQIQEGMGGRMGSILLRTGALSEDVLLTTLSRQLGADYLRAAGDLPDSLVCYQFMVDSPIRPEWYIDRSVVLWPLPEEEDGGETLGCLADDVLDLGLRSALGYFFPGVKIRYYLCAAHHRDRLLEFMRKELAVEELFSSGDARQLKELAEQAPIVELVNNMLAQAVDAGASDVHIEPSESDFTVRLRVDGILHTRLAQPVERFPAVASRIKLISGIDIAERRLPQDGRISARVSGREMDIRVSTVPCVHGESVVMRLLPKEREDLALTNLGMEKDHLAMFSDWVTSSNGIILVTGPTGSGKSTTLYASLIHTNDGIKKILTVEDPVEVQVPGVTQIQAHMEIGYTFARALRAILRQDPDVIMIGEIRDLETAEIAVQSALTGHVVLSTLHTNDAASSFIRLVDMGIEPFLVAAPIRGVQAQRLVRRVCSHCAEPVRPQSVILDQMAKLPGGEAGDSWQVPKGCRRCHNTGYSGRLGVYELIPVDTNMQEMIVRGATTNEIRAEADKAGFRTLYQDGLLKASRGLTTLDEINRVLLAD